MLCVGYLVLALLFAALNGLILRRCRERGECPDMPGCDTEEWRRAP